MNGMSPTAHRAEVARRLADHVRSARRRAQRVEAVADSPDGLIRATVGGHGQVLALDLDPRIFRHTDSRALADAVTGTIRDAQHAVNREISELAKGIPGP